MNIVYLVFNTVGKGTYWRALALAKALKRSGHNMTLVTTSQARRWRTSTYVDDGVVIVETPDLFTGSLRSGWDPWNSLRRIAWAHGQRADLVHAFELRPTVSAPALYLKFARRTPFVSDWADWFGKGGSVEERPNPLVRAVLRPVETLFESGFRTQGLGVTAICTLLQEKALALGFEEDAVLLLPNGSDTERYYPLPRADALRRTSLPPEYQYIGYLGSIFRQDAELMAQAFDRVHAQRPQTRLVVVGACPVDISGLVQSPSAVIHTGYLDSGAVNAYLSSCDALWLPLRNSNANRGRMPMKLNDYMSAGRPTVATAVGDMPALFAQEPIGRVAPDDAQPFAAETIALLDDADLRARLGSHARHVAETRFSWDALAASLHDFYAKMLARKR